MHSFSSNEAYDILRAIENHLCALQDPGLETCAINCLCQSTSESIQRLIEYTQALCTQQADQHTRLAARHCEMMQVYTSTCRECESLEGELVALMLEVKDIAKRQSCIRQAAEDCRNAKRQLEEQEKAIEEKKELLQWSASLLKEYVPSATHGGIDPITELAVAPIENSRLRVQENIDHCQEELEGTLAYCEAISTEVRQKRAQVREKKALIATQKTAKEELEHATKKVRKTVVGLQEVRSVLHELEADFDSLKHRIIRVGRVLIRQTPGELTRLCNRIPDIYNQIVLAAPAFFGDRVEEVVLCSGRRVLEGIEDLQRVLSHETVAREIKEIECHYNIRNIVDPIESFLQLGKLLERLDSGTEELPCNENVKKLLLACRELENSIRHNAFQIIERSMSVLNSLGIISGEMHEGRLQRSGGMCRQIMACTEEVLARLNAITEECECIKPILARTLDRFQHDMGYMRYSIEQIESRIGEYYASVRPVYADGAIAAALLSAAVNKITHHQQDCLRALMARPLGVHECEERKEKLEERWEELIQFNEPTQYWSPVHEAQACLSRTSEQYRQLTLLSHKFTVIIESEEMLNIPWYTRNLALLWLSVANMGVTYYDLLALNGNER